MSYADAIQGYSYATEVLPATEPSSIFYADSTVDLDIDLTPLVLKYSVLNDQLIFTFNYSASWQIKVNGNWYKTPAGSHTIVINGPFGNPFGTIDVQPFFTYTGGLPSLSYPIRTLNLKPFAVPSPVSIASPEAMVIPSGWVTFEKSFGFNAAIDTVNVYSIVEDTPPGESDFYAPLTVPVQDGIYLPDFGTDSIQIGADTDAPRVDLFSTNVALYKTIFTQLYSPDVKTIMPTVSNGTDNSNATLPIKQYVNIRSVTKPTHNYHIDNAVARAGCEVLLNDGTMRLLIANTATRRFDLYAVSNTGATLMFEDIWNEDYHGAQIAWLMDGTLVSYAWRISYFAGDDDHAAGIRYALYFKRSLDDGTHWEIQQTVAENITSLQTLPVLTQQIKTGKITIGDYHSDNMGLDWEANE